MPQGSEDKLMVKLNAAFDENASTRSNYYGRNRKTPKDFTIKHFAGDVIYTVTDFMEKNKDALATKILHQVQSSTVELLRTEMTQESEQGAHVPKGKTASKMTLAAKFKLDLDTLMTSLRLTVPHFIRCIKPNDFQVRK